MKKTTILAATLAASMISAQATVVFTADFSSFDNTSADAQVLSGDPSHLAFGDLFGSDAHVTADGSLNLGGNTNGRSAGVWLDSSLWDTGDGKVTFDISGLDLTPVGAVASIQIYTADNLAATPGNGAGLDMRTGGDPTMSQLTMAGPQQLITANGSQTFDFASVAGTDATAIVFNIDGGAAFDVESMTVACPVPEPSSTALLGLGGLALIARRTRK